MDSVQCEDGLRRRRRPTAAHREAKRHVAKVARDGGAPPRTGQRSVAAGAHRGKAQHLNGPRRALVPGSPTIEDGRRAAGEDDRPTKALVLDEVSKRIIEEL